MMPLDFFFSFFKLCLISFSLHPHSNQLDNSRPRSSSPRRLRRLPLPTRPRERRRYGSIRSNKTLQRRRRAAAAAIESSCDRSPPFARSALPPCKATTLSTGRPGSRCAEPWDRSIARAFRRDSSAGDQSGRGDELIPFDGGGGCKALSPDFLSLTFLFFLSLSQQNLNPHHNNKKQKWSKGKMKEKVNNLVLFDKVRE